MQVSEFYTSNKQAMPFIVLLCDDVLVEVLLFATRHQLAGIEVCGYRFHRFIDGNQNTGAQEYNVGVFVEKPLLLFDLRFKRHTNLYIAREFKFKLYTTPPVPGVYICLKLHVLPMPLEGQKIRTLRLTIRTRYSLGKKFHCVFRNQHIRNYFLPKFNSEIPLTRFGVSILRLKIRKKYEHV